MRGLAAAVAVLAGLAVALGLLLGADAGTGDAAERQGAATRPNVVVIVTDDQRAETLRVMTEARRLLGRRGATFGRSYVNFALCCPSRASLLTGQYAHNHGVLGNKPPEGGFEVFEERHGADNLATWMNGAGYWTALVGKYFNGYGEDDPRFVPAGWDEWIASTPPGQRVYDYTLNHDGRLIDYGNDPRDFKEDVLTDAAVRVIARRAPAEQPFFLTLAYTAPHVGGPKVSEQPPHDCVGAAKPAPRHAHAFDSARLPTPRSFDEADVGDKPPGV